MAKKKSTGKNGNPPEEDSLPKLVPTGRLNQSSSSPSSGTVKSESKGSASGNDLPEYTYIDEEEDPREKYMSLGDHLEELRKRIIWSLLVISIAAGVAGYFSNEIHEFLMIPLRKISSLDLLMRKPTGKLESIFKLSMLVGFTSSFPVILMILWGFITPAINRLASFLGYLGVGISSFLFWGGVLFSWYYIIPISLEFLLNLNMSFVKTEFTVEEYYDFLFMLEMGTGLVFQMPLILVVLGALGILTVEFHKRIWKFVIVGILAASAVITPPDVFSQLILSGPLITLYFLAVFVVWIIEYFRKKKDKELYGDEMEQEAEA